MFELEKLIPRNDAKRLWLLAENAKKLVRDLITEHNIVCDLKPGLIAAASKRSHYRYLDKYADHLRSKYDYNHLMLLDRSDIQKYIDTNIYYGDL